MRIGHGIDIHQFENNVPLVLGGVAIDSPFGIKGHSDGDIVIHALVDALLGSMCLGDIGTHFPSNEKKWKNCDSKIFLTDTLQKISKLNYKIENIDITIILQQPYIQPFINKIRNSLAKIMSININQISVKATTSDYLGFVGNKEGIVSTACVLISKDKHGNKN